jgi:hypothetical protein
MNSHRKYIDKLVEFINSVASEKKENGDYITEIFLESNDFRDKAHSTLNALCPFFRYPIPSDDEFINYFSIALGEFISNNPIVIEASTSLKSRYDKPSWLTEERFDDIGWNYTDRYFTYLELNGRNKKVIDETFNSSKSILEKLGDPKSSEEFFVRGLVVGSVQSG